MPHPQCLQATRDTSISLLRNRFGITRPPGWTDSQMNRWLRTTGDYTHTHTVITQPSGTILHTHTQLCISHSAVMRQSSSVKRKAGWAASTGKPATLRITMTRLPPRSTNMAQNTILAFWVNCKCRYVWRHWLTVAHLPQYRVSYECIKCSKNVCESPLACISVHAW